MNNVSNIIRVLQIGMHDEIGGVETYLMNYYRNIDRTKIQFDFINPYNKLCFENEINELGGVIYKIPNFKKNPIGYYRKIKKIIKENNYQIVHINMLSSANILPVIATKKCKVRHIIVHSHNNNIPTGIIRRILDKVNKKVVLKYATDLFACSDLAGLWMFENQNFTLIENAIDLTNFKFSINIREKIRKELKVDDKFVIGHVGRFCYQKNHEFLIDVFNQVQKEIKNAVLILIGAGKLEEEIKKKVNDLNINNKVIFLGTTDKVNEYFNAMDLFVLPSRFEGLPVVGIEAQALNLKCFLSQNITKKAKMIDKTEFLPINDAKIWADSIKDYINNKNNENIEENFPKEYDIKYAAKKLEKIYEKMEENEKY